MPKKKTSHPPGGLRSRIKELRYVRASELRANPKNWRKHPLHQINALTSVLKSVGFAGASLGRELPDGSIELIDGHARTGIAESEGNVAIPVLITDLSDEEVNVVLATYDPLGAMAEADKEKLDDLLRQTRIDDEGVRALLAETAKGLGLDYGAPLPEDPLPQLNRAEELREKWGTALGQLWELEEHKLLCGDCTNQAVVGRVMGGERIEMVWTDPPYGVAVGDKNKFLNSIAPSNRVEENLENDTLDESGIVQMLCSAFDNAIEHCLAGASWYVAAPAGPLHILFGQVLKDRGIWRQTIQWVKNNSTFSPMGVCYHWQAEPIFFGWLPDGGHRYYGGRTQTTVWNIDRPVKSPEHPTMKPVELVARAVVNSSRVGEIVFDPFGGSGTTMVACNNLGRKCRMIEIDPRYCAVVLERMSVLGVSPILVK